MPKVKIELLVNDARGAEVVQIIETAARTGKIGDGKITVSTLEEVIRIRTGQRGPEAV